ncbi:MAG TPA: macrolide ABC transporter ATP-binding protein [Candidatus Aminicenantes bacterium]|nr:macrolide ABC transporter ATP-binding protein [Candidatus Aminicenantes bacterium]
MIKMEKINKTYGTGSSRVEAIKEIDLEIKENEFVGLIGPSGSGKSTLMNIIGCLDMPTSGDYFFEGEKVQGFSSNQLAEIRNRKIGFVFQNFNLLPYATTFENVELPMIFKGASSRARRAKVMELLERVNLAARAHHRPSELSGGEMQRVAIARALTNDPRLILADEPTGNLDTKSGQEILRIFEELWSQGHTLVIITHNPYIADCARRVVKLRDGLVEEDSARM